MAEDQDRDRERFESPGSEEALGAEDDAKAAIYESVETNTGYEPEFEGAWHTGRRLDLNTASEEELQELPGIGPELAAEIVAYRTQAGGFREAAEVTRVPGITPDLYDRFADQVTAGADVLDEYVVEEGEILPVEAVDVYEEPPILDVPPDEEERLVLDEPPPELTEDEELLVPDEPLPAEAAPPPPPPPPARTVREVAPAPRRGLGWGSLLLVGLLSAIAGALLALLVLWLLNGTLDVQQAAERRLRGEVFRLEGDMETIRSQVGGVEERLAGVEGLAGDLEAARGEIGDLGSMVDGLQSDVTSATQRLDDMQETIAGLSDDMVNVEESVTTLGTQLGDVEARLGTMAEELAEAQEAVARFDAFLAGLRELLSETAATDGTATESPGFATMTPLASPTPTGGGTPSAATATPRANVTVIPLATPTPTPTGQ